MVQVTIGKWGDSFVLRLPGEVVAAARLHDGERVDVAAEDGNILIRRLDSETELAELFRGKTPEEWRKEYAAAFDWGPDLGRETIEE